MLICAIITYLLAGFTYTSGEGIRPRLSADQSASVWAPPRGLACWLDIAPAFSSPSHSTLGSEALQASLPNMAERAGFEPAEPVKARQFSKLLI